MQSRWKTWPQFPKAIDRPLSLVGEGLAWYSIDGSFKELRQMAHYQWTNERRTICKSYNACPTREAKKKGGPTFTHKVPTVSAQISHDHMATAFHFLISNLGGAPVVLAPALATGLQACQTKRERERKWQVWNEWRFDDATLFVCCHYTKLTASAICVSAIISIKYFCDSMKNVERVLSFSLFQMMVMSFDLRCAFRRFAVRRSKRY